MYYPNYTQSMPQLYPAQNTIPANIGQDVIGVSGISGAYQCQLPPGTHTILVTDREMPIVYLITVNGSNRSVQAFDITPHQDQTPKNQNESTLDQILDKITALEGEVNELKSNNAGSKPKYAKSGNGSNAGGH